MDAMKHNDRILDPDGRPARIVTLPIPGRPVQLATIQYDDGRGRVVDLAQCRIAEKPQEAPQ